MEYNGRKLHRIQALKDFDNIEKGELGGWLESRFNLSQKGNCWIYNNVKILDRSKVQDNVVIKDNVIIKNNVIINGNTFINGNCVVDFDIDYNFLFENQKQIEYYRENKSNLKLQLRGLK